MSLSIQEIHKIYNDTNKDMPRHEFVKEMQRLTSQAGIQRDLQGVIATKQTRAIAEARERQKIDRVTKE